MSTRVRLPLAPARPAAKARVATLRSSTPPLVTGRVVLAVIGDDALVRSFVASLVACAAGECAVLEPGHFADDPNTTAILKAHLEALPRDAWVLAAGAEASARLQPTFLVGLGLRHEMAAVATDLWLGQSSEVVASALVEALRSSTKS